MVSERKTWDNLVPDARQLLADQAQESLKEGLKHAQTLSSSHVVIPVARAKVLVNIVDDYRRLTG